MPLRRYDRLLTGTLNACYDELQLKRFGVVVPRALQAAITSMARQIGNILGVHPVVYKFFRHPQTGDPLTPRLFVQKRVTCVDNKSQLIYMPSCNTLKSCPYAQGSKLESHPNGNHCFDYEWESSVYR